MQPPSSLYPTYANVERFGPDEDYEGEEEINYVTLDLGDVEPQLVPSSTTYRLIGLDSPTPFLQLQGTIMKGRHTSLIGTELFFMDDSKEIHDWNNRPAKYVAKTEQRILFQEITLIPKTSGDSNVKGGGRAGDSDGTFGSVPQPTFGENMTSALEADSAIDALTGVVAPVLTRAPRQKKKEGAITGAGTSPARTKKKGAGLASASSKTSKVTKSAKAKGKEKEVVVPVPLPPEVGVDVPMDEDVVGAPAMTVVADEDNADDMYVDE